MRTGFRGSGQSRQISLARQQGTYARDHSSKEHSQAAPRCLTSVRNSRFECAKCIAREAVSLLRDQSPIDRCRRNCGGVLDKGGLDCDGRDNYPGQMYSCPSRGTARWVLGHKRRRFSWLRPVPSPVYFGGSPFDFSQVCKSLAVHFEPVSRTSLILPVPLSCSK